MNASRKLLVALLSLSCITLVLIFAWDAPSAGDGSAPEMHTSGLGRMASTDEARPVRGIATQDPKPGPPALAQLAPSRLPESAGASQGREATAADLDFLVQGASGNPIHGAEVSWTPWRLLPPDRAAPGFTPDDWALASQVAHTDRDGHGALRIPATEQGGVLWATKPGFESAFQLVSGSDRNETLTIRLEARPAWDVRVVDHNGAPVEEARVFLTGAPITTSPLLPSERHLEAQLLMRATTTGASGTIELGALPSSGRTWAEKDGMSSTHVPADSQEDIVLLLEETFRVDGRVTGLASDQAAFCTVVFEEDSEQDLEVAVLPVEGGVRIAPGSIVKRPGGQYRFQLEGPGIAPSFVRISSERIQDPLHLVLTARPGLALPLRFIDDQERPVEGVLVRLVWVEDDILVGAGGRSVSDVRGAVDLRCPKSPVSVWFQHPDFLSGTRDDIYLDESRETPLTIQLEPFGRVTGVVKFNGQPVTNYRLHYGPGLSRGAVETLEVAGSEDGRFVIERAPIGELELFALAPGLPQSDFALTEVKQNEVAEVEILVPKQGIGIGRVIDASSGAPIADCSVDRYLRSANGVGLLLAFEHHPTDMDGRFSFPGFGAGREQVWMTAPDHAGSIAQASRGADGGYDFGVIRLERTNTLTLEFTGTTDFSNYTFQVEGAKNEGPSPVPPSGVVVLENTLPNQLLVYVNAPSGIQRQYGFPLLTSGPWNASVPVTGKGTLHLSIEGMAKDKLKGFWLMLIPSGDPMVDGETFL